MSSPEGSSINDGIPKEMCSLRYVSVDDIIPKLLQLGQGALMAKLDIESAYRIVPVHPEDRHLLGIRWEGKFFVDTALPFGMRSAPKIFNAVADGLEWIMKAQGVSHVDHYLDDFIFLGPPGSPECDRNMRRALDICRELGVPVAAHKCEGPTPILTFLGIELDSTTMEIRLPYVKIVKLKSLIASWRSRKSCRRRELESLVGHLCHACKVVRPGRRFLRGFFQLLSKCRRRHFCIRLNCGFRADLEWWHTFLIGWNGASMLYPVHAQQARIHVWSDASGSWGAAAICESQWFQIKWCDFPEFQSASIVVKELLPILVAATVWGPQWQTETVCFHCDNAAVVSIIKGGYCKDQHMAHMLRCLFFLEAKFQFTSISVHIPGVANTIADALSRNNMTSFYSLAPQAYPSPILIPHSTINGLIAERPWTSHHWMQWFNSICGQH